MKDDSFILMSLKDGKSKKLAQVMTNDSSRKILDFLGRKEDATESLIAKELNLPISTVHYNVKLLVESGFLTADEYHYSEKGKEVLHYKLANKIIVIAPGTTFGFKQKLRRILPVGLVGIGLAFLIKLFVIFNSADLMPRKNAVVEGVEIFAADKAMNAPAGIAPKSVFCFDIALWFFLGILTAIILILVFDWLRRRK